MARQWSGARRGRHRSLVLAKRTRRKAQTPDGPLSHVGQACARLVQSAALGLVSVAASCAALLTDAHAAHAQETLQLPMSSRQDIYVVQQALMQAWKVVDSVYFDTATLSRIDWRQSLSRAMWRASTAESAQLAESELSAMLLGLGDPYTRVVPQRSYADYQTMSKSEVRGVGLLLAAEPTTRSLLVLAPLQNSPAARAGIQSGDRVLAIDDRPTDEMDMRDAAELLNGTSGSSVRIQLFRPGTGLPGVPQRPPAGVHEAPARQLPFQLQASAAVADGGVKTVTLQREVVAIGSVVAAKVGLGGHAIGYVRLDAFTQRAAEEMREAVAGLLDQRVEGFVLDLRDNTGGLVDAGMNVARIFMPGESAVVNISGRGSGPARMLTVPPASLPPPAADRPLSVLVNGRTASASEILVGALRDNGRARVVGDSTTLGKGRMQAAYRLVDGSMLLVSVAQYRTPLSTDIDMVGIVPDIKCSMRAFEDGRDSIHVAASMPAQEFLEDLFSDPCFVTAARSVTSQITHKRAVPSLPSASLLSQVSTAIQKP